MDPRRLWEPERTRMAAVYYAGPGQPPGRRHSPVSTRARSHWLGTRLHGQGWNGLKARTYGGPGRMGRRASNVSLGAYGTLIPITGVINDNCIFSVTDRTLFKVRDGSCRYPITGNVCHDYIGYNRLSLCYMRSMLEHARPDPRRRLTSASPAPRGLACRPEAEWSFLSQMSQHD